MQTTFNAGLAYSEYRSIRFSYINAAIVAFIMSSYFVVGYLAGDLLFWAWDIAQGMNGGVGVGICLVMTSYQFILYARGDVKGGKKATIVAVCVAVGFSLLSEVGQGMERDHVRMETRSIESPTYKAIVGQIGTTTGVTGHPYSSQLASAKMKLARCQQNVSTGLWADCVESTARLASVQGMIQQYYQQHQQHAVTLANTAKTMEKDESNYHPLVNLIKGGLASTAVFASFILSLILISFFEYAFHYLGRQLAASRAQLLDNGYDVTQKTRKIPLSFRTQTNKKALPPADTWNDELSKSGIDSPDDKVLNQAADPEQIKRIVDAGQSVSEVSDKASGYRARTVPDTFQDAADKLYPAWVDLLKSAAIKPTIRPARKLIAEQLCSQRKAETITPAQIDIVINGWIARALSEGIIQDNKAGGVGKPKYIIAGHNPKTGTKEKQLDMHLS